MSSLKACKAAAREEESGLSGLMFRMEEASKWHFFLARFEIIHPVISCTSKACIFSSHVLLALELQQLIRP